MRDGAETPGRESGKEESNSERIDRELIELLNVLRVAVGLFGLLWAAIPVTRRQRGETA